MKKYLISLMLLGTLAVSAFGQAQITTRKFRLSDFTDKILKVVLTGNEMTDGGFRQAVMDRWSLSPFEFCTLAEFDKLRPSADFYFLIIHDGKTSQEEDAQIRYLSLLKGGNANLSEMMQIVSIPIGPVGSGSGRELTFLPAFLDIIQDYTQGAIDKEIGGYTSLSRYNANYRRDGKTKRILFSEEDVADAVNENFRKKMEADDMVVLPEEEADNAFTEGTFNVLVSYVAFPAEIRKGASCYLMLIEADTHTLYYYKRQKITQKMTAGFMPEELNFLAKKRK